MLDEAKDPAIKLFGKTITLPETITTASADVDLSGGSAGSADVDKEAEIGCSRNNVSDVEGTETGNRKAELEDATDSHSEAQVLAQNSDEFVFTPTTASVPNKNPSPESELSAAQQSSNTEDEENKSQQSGPQDKTLKKPDKILPCPRCSSMETKFCYFNNYNVNQPRHFCKNCQRYWTAGGTMRNVPVGAGRRKSKSTASQYRHIVVSESLQNGGGDLHNRLHYPGPRPTNGALVSFGSDNPMCNSMASIVNIVENGIHKPDLKLTNSLGTKEINGASQIDGAVSVETDGKTGTKEQGESDNVHVYPSPPVPCFPGAPWPYPWNSTQWSPQLPNPGFGSSGYPVAFYPPGAYWGCSVPGTWAFPWTQPPQSNSPKGSNSGSSPNSPILGKHSRDGNILMRPNGLGDGEKLKDSKPERSLWIPKTLRIDDPEQAAKSSIWTTLGIKNHKPDSACGTSGMFRACFTNVDEKSRFVENARALDVNPAAMSRSQAFNETT